MKCTSCRVYVCEVPLVMKVKVLCRNPDDYLRETKKDIHKGKSVFLSVRYCEWQPVCCTTS